MAAGTVRVSRRGVEFLAAAIALDQIWATPGVELRRHMEVRSCDLWK